MKTPHFRLKIWGKFGGPRKFFEKFGGVRNIFEKFGGVRKIFEKFGGVRKILRFPEKSSYPPAMEDPLIYSVFLRVLTPSLREITRI